MANIQKRSKSLDFLRGVAIFLVLFYHAKFFFPLTKIPVLLDLILLGSKFGYIGVDLFFVLSGFLVTGLLFSENIRTGKINFMRFYIRRGLKIYPAFWGFIIVTVIYRLIIGREIGWYNFISEILFVQNYFGQMAGHTWSLAVEEHFYITIGIIVFLLIKTNNLKKFIPLFLVTATSILALRCYLHLKFSDTSIQASHLRIDALFMGSVLAYLNHYHRQKFLEFYQKYKYYLPLILALSIGALISANLNSFYVTTFNFTVLYLGFSALLLTSIFESRIYNWLPSWPYSVIAWAGYYSYSIYLWHFMARTIIYDSLRAAGLSNTIVTYLGLIIYLPSAVLFGALLAKLIEMPVLKLRDKYLASPHSSQLP